MEPQQHGSVHIDIIGESGASRQGIEKTNARGTGVTGPPGVQLPGGGAAYFLSRRRARAPMARSPEPTSINDMGSGIAVWPVTTTCPVDP